MFRDINQIDLANLETVYYKFNALFELVSCMGVASSGSVFDVNAMCDMLYSVGYDALQDFKRELFQDKEAE